MEEQVQEQEQIKNPDLVLDLTLSRKDLDRNSKPELALFQTNPPASTESENRVFSCNYCNRKFYSSQALGAIRTPTSGSGRSRGEASALAARHSATMMPRRTATRALLLSLCMDPSTGPARKPLDQQPAVGRLAVENHQVGPSSSGGAARFDGGRRFSTAVDGIGGFRWDNNSSHLKTNNQEELKKLDLSLKL
ncbi:UNVERIFIED_CONTAM: hypothetical protein Scaly_1878600 [Sesamum calycinum]|uniref:Uncharacterized protein n=1 Tax=Sesamum calycinum TaxID=2727403 RepID=A0AAW2NH93_9LAMI